MGKSSVLRPSHRRDARPCVSTRERQVNCPIIKFTHHPNPERMPYHRRRCKPAAQMSGAIIMCHPSGVPLPRIVFHTRVNTRAYDIPPPWGGGGISLRMGDTLFQNCSINAHTTQRT